MVNTGRIAATTRAESVMEMPGRGGPVELADVDSVVVGVKVGLGTDVEKLGIVKEMEIEETAQKS